MSKVINLDSAKNETKTDNDLKKGWAEMVNRVEKEISRRYNAVPIAERRELGLEDGKKAHENREWVGKYLEALVWRDMCYELMREKAYSKGEESGD
jgi:hypothetical protein